jgi:hypothetical protein
MAIAPRALPPHYGDVASVVSLFFIIFLYYSDFISMAAARLDKKKNTKSLECKNVKIVKKE